MTPVPVAIPVFNDAPTRAVGLTSPMRRTRMADEIIVVDNRSAVGPAAVCRQASGQGQAEWRVVCVDSDEVAERGQGLWLTLPGPGSGEGADCDEGRIGGRVPCAGHPENGCAADGTGRRIRPEP